MADRRLASAVGLLLVLMLIVAWWAASVQASLMQQWLAAGGVPFPASPWKAASPPTVASYFSINAAFVTLLLLVPAVSLFVLRRTDEPGPAWRIVWTAALVAFLVHLIAGIGAVQDNGQPPRVANPIGDSLVAIWWIVDVALAWLLVSELARPRKWVEWERAALHLVIVLSAAVSAIILSGHCYIRLAGIFLVGAALLCIAWRLVVYPFDIRSPSAAAYVLLFGTLNRLVAWHRLPTWLSILNLGALRTELRRKNLHDTSTIPVSNAAGLSPMPQMAPTDLVRRNMDGYFNDLAKPAMGSSSAPNLADHESMHFEQSNPGARFGRNVPLADAFPDEGQALLTPSPRQVSRELLARRSLIEAPTLNYLAAAWIQFQTHDWFNHGDPRTENPFELPLAKGDDWDFSPMTVRRTRADPTRDYETERRMNGDRLRYPPTYVNAESHWWDASQIYGSNAETTAKLRKSYRREGDKLFAGDVLADGKLYLDEGNLVLDPSSLDENAKGLTGFSGNWWAGLSLLHTLFAREHNAICDHLKPLYPHWDSDELFHTARMINSALMAKIHTVEWTPAILGSPAMQIGMNANWWGLQTERLYRSIGRISENEAFSGVPLSGVDHHGADYCLTEEFTSVYRLHPLLRDEMTISSHATGAALETMEMTKGLVGNENELTVFRDARWRFADVLYSFGVTHPGAITVHNYPAFMRHLKRPDGELIDMATIDVLRDRERGVPRYNRFLELFHKPPIKSFDDLANKQHPGLQAELRAIYGQTNGRDNVDKLDLMVGLFCEEVPDGFGFSDTAFRVFVLMATRRLKSDRFVARDFLPEVYTPEGIAWVNDNSFVSLVRRHFPELRPALYGVTNGFKPWRETGVAV